MQVVVVGGTGLVGTELVRRLQDGGHHAVPASPGCGVNSLTGEGLEAALSGATVVVDVTNPPSVADRDPLDFFTTSTGNLLSAARRAGVRHYVALSVVGAERLPGSPYMRAKLAQEQLIARSDMASSIVRATQFFEFAPHIAAAATVDGDVRLAPALFQPIAVAEVVDLLIEVVLGDPENDVVETGGPEQVRLDEFVGLVLAARGDQRAVVADPQARYFGALLDQDTLLPGQGARLGVTRYVDWLSR